MKSREKLILMEEKINTINTTILKNKDWKIEFINRGANNYCLIIKLKNNKEYFNGTFVTYESVLSALDLILNMFSAELNKKGGK